MKFKYRVKGIVERAFILRGAYFPIGSDMDFYVAENELQFVKDRCKVEQLIDTEKQPIETPSTVLEETKSEIENKPKEVENELRPKQPNNGNKGKSKSCVRVAQ